jgi:hypothetical protein
MRRIKIYHSKLPELTEAEAKDASYKYCVFQKHPCGATGREQRLKVLERGYNVMYIEFTLR